MTTPEGTERPLHFSFGGTEKSADVARHAGTWSRIVKLIDPANPRTKKDCGNIVGGVFDENYRCREDLASRSMLTLDVDDNLPALVADVRWVMGSAALLYTTWSNREVSKKNPNGDPRWRLFAPLSRDVSGEDYWFLSNAVMHDLGIVADTGGAEAERLMHLPSTQNDHYEHHVIEGPPLDVDVWLARAKALAIGPRPIGGGGGAGSGHDRASYDDPTVFDDLTEDQQRQARESDEQLIKRWSDKFAAVVLLEEEGAKHEGRGWGQTARSASLALACRARCPWSPMTWETAIAAYDAMVPEDIANAEHVNGGLTKRVRRLAEQAAVSAPPWARDTAPTVEEVFGALDAEDPPASKRKTRLDRPKANVSDPTKALRWVSREIGRNGLAGLFARGGAIVYTPRVDEVGYVPPKNENDNDGPAQVRRIEGWKELARRVDHGYQVVKVVKDKEGNEFHVPVLFPKAVAERVITAIDLMPNLRVLRSVTHTPSLKGDGSVLDAPGYDDTARVMYLPIPGLVIPSVSPEPTPGEVKAAVALLAEMVAQFPFVTPHHRANYLGALLTPLLRELVPPPYQALVITAHQRGSGKSLLAFIMREIHGGVFRSEFPKSEEELHKSITAVLFATTGPVIQFDNLKGVLNSGTLDGLLTSDKFDGRKLGVNTENLALTNDRLWVFTGNNVRIGGDAARRLLWVTLDHGVEKPEDLEFEIMDLKGWVRERRGVLLHAMLTILRGWVVAGQPVTGALDRSDDYGRWVQVLRGVLDWSGLDTDAAGKVGVFGHVESQVEEADEETEEWARFLRAAHRVFGPKKWTAKELMTTVPADDAPPSMVKVSASVLGDELPGDVLEKHGRNKTAGSKALGNWLRNRNGRWAGGLSAQKFDVDRNGVARWHVVQPKRTD